MIVRRLWVPFYEQGRHFIARGLEEEVIYADSSFYAPEVLERLVDHYVSSEFAPDAESVSSRSG